MEDHTAISLLKNGDLAGLESLVANYQVKALHTAQLILRDRILAEEVVQTAFIRCAERIRQFDENRPFAPWFLRIVANDALKMAQRQKKTISLDEEADDEVSRFALWLIDPQPNPEISVEIKESAEVIRSALERLTPEQRTVVVMRYFLDLNESEMSAQLKRPVSTIKWWLREARLRLRNLLRSSHSFEEENGESHE